MQTIQSTQQVAGLMRPNRIKDKNLIAALENTNRADYLPEDLKHLSGTDAPVPFGHTRGTASPLTMAHLIQALNIPEGAHVTVLAANTGYSTALLSQLVGPQGSVTAVEDDEGLLPHLIANTQTLGNVTVVSANPATYAGQGASAVLLDATIHQLPAHAVNLLEDGATMATLHVQPTGLPAAVLYRRHGKALFEEVMFDLKGQTQDIEDDRFTVPQTFVF